jgi:hypothetical protein
LPVPQDRGHFPTRSIATTMHQGQNHDPQTYADQYGENRSTHWSTRREVEASARNLSTLFHVATVV